MIPLHVSTHLWKLQSSVVHLVTPFGQSIYRPQLVRYLGLSGSAFARCTYAGIDTGLAIAGSSGGGKSDMLQYFSAILYVHFRNSMEGEVNLRGGKSPCSPPFR